MSSMTKTIVLIPAARPIAPELQFEFGKISPCMIPLLGKPLLYHLSRKYSEKDKIIIASYNDKKVSEYCLHINNPHISIKQVSDTKSIADTINIALKGEDVKNTSLIINFADTITDNANLPTDAVVYSMVSDKSRWTCFENVNGVIENIKDRIDSENEEPAMAFVGIFKISNLQLFLSLLQSFNNQPRTEIEPFYLALQQYSVEVKLEYIDALNWKDFGHIDNYFAMRHDLSMGEREFNELNISRDSGVIRKYSRNTAKFVNEIAWYLKLPKDVTHVAPRVLDHSLDENKPYVDLEFYSYPSLSDLYLFSNLDTAAWKKIFLRIFAVIDAMSAHKKQADVSSLKNMYLDKTFERLNHITNDAKFTDFLNEVTINGKNCKGIKQILNSLEEDAKRFGILDTQQFQVIHGDLCFSNILYDRKLNIIRLIDPRGSFGSHDIYGDIRYDMAKLCHSVLGDYDFMVNGLCSVDNSKQGYQLKIFHSDEYMSFKNLFRKMLIGKINEQEFTRIRFIESLLFLSMVPLHADNILAQKAFLCRGISLYNEVTS
jgi:hypothetical protein